MRPDLLAHLDACWAARLNCDPSLLHNQNTNILPDPCRFGAEVWLFDKTCVMVAAPPLAQALKASVGMRNPLVAFEPGRLKATMATFGLELHGPEAILVWADAAATPQAIHWIPARETEAELATVIRGGTVGGSRILAVTIPLKQRPARRAAESYGFELYASVIYLGERPDFSGLVVL